MAKLSRLAGSTGHILTLYVQDTRQGTGAGLTGLTNASAGLSCAYKRNTDAAAQVVALDAVATLGTYGGYAVGHGGFKEIDPVNLPGFYEFQPPDAAFGSGAKSVAFLIRGAANMAPVLLEIELTAVDNQNASSFGVANLDAAVSSRSTYAGDDTSGTTTLLSRLPSALAVSDGKVTATLDMTQVVPTSNTSQTVGDALNAARAQGFGKWVLSDNTLTLYAADGTTAVRTFTLDSATAPTQRS
jgi:hypothetical protein